MTKRRPVRAGSERLRTCLGIAAACPAKPGVYDFSPGEILTVQVGDARGKRGHDGWRKGPDRL
ncbi:hypothetical protein GCM10008171_23010 [Methylopila jiangsuensis]|uniref:Uncharacterized protein n=1 Tax=Methylopila jiangsuensis TaxID=586230 RepID=A0A9W6JHB2_9HYPH|nr:hypothetical protein GCM10008171_23010 [Methylopila jiangsuensis]